MIAEYTQIYVSRIISIKMVLCLNEKGKTQNLALRFNAIFLAWMYTFVQCVHARQNIPPTAERKQMREQINARWRLGNFLFVSYNTPPLLYVIYVSVI